MTEAVVVPLSTYSLTGTATGPFATSWGYEAAGEVQVWIVEADGTMALLESGTDYTLTPGAVTLTDGGSVTLAGGTVPGDGWTSGDKVAITRNTPVSQPEPLGDRAAITPSTVEATINRVVRQVQDGRREQNRATRVPLGEAGLALASADARAGKLQEYDDDGASKTDRGFTDVVEAAGALVGTEALAQIAAAGDAEEGNVTAKGTQQVGLVQAAGDEQVARVEATVPLIQPQIQRMWKKIRAGQEDVYIFVNSDSTWNANDEPFYRWVAEVLGPAALTHTIAYRLYVDGSGWGAPITLQSGTGARSIYIDNAAIPGSGLAYINGAKEAEIFADQRTYDVAIINHGHNFGYDLTATDLYPYMMIQAANIMSLCPAADVFVTLQNPWLAHLAYSRATQMVWRRIANMLGLGIIDVASRFEALGDLDDAAVGGVGGTVDLAYYAQDGQGGLHPAAPAGVNVALPALTAALAEGTPTGASTLPRSPLNDIRENLMPNPKYADWTGSAPASHTLVGLTASKSVAYAEKGAYALALTCDATASPAKSVDLSGALTAARGKWLTYLARVWVPSTMDTRAGRLQLLTTGASNRSTSSIVLNVGKDGWAWVMVCHQILPTDVTITASLLAGAADGSDNGETLYVDREIVCIGLLPCDITPSSTAGAFVSDYFDSRQVGVPAGYTGTVTLTGNDVDLTGGTAAFSRAYGNFKTVPGRTYKIAWGVRSFTGAAGLSMFARGANGGGTVIATAAPLNNNSSLSFVATNAVTAWSIAGGSNVTAFNVADIVVTEIYAGLIAQRLPLTDARNTDGTVADATGAAGKFKLVSTLGTSLYLQGEDAQSNTKTDTAVWEVSLPTAYIPGRDLVVTVNAETNGAGTAGTRTVDVRAYEIADAGTEGADLCATAAQTVTASAADYTFTVTGTGLVAGDRVRFVVETAIQETGGASAIQGIVNSVRWQ